MPRSRLLSAVLLTAFAAAGGVRAEDESKAIQVVEAIVGSSNIAWKTLGGTQVWSDEFVYGDWRIQRNALTKHCRLLDDEDIRREAGSYDDCYAKFVDLRDKLELKPPSGKAVILLHGLARSRDMMADLAGHLKETGYTPINLGYASTRRTIDDHAENLGLVLERLEGPTEINFVCHSLGNLVVRRYISRSMEPDATRPLDPRIKRMVMLGPPNQGAAFASHLKGNQLCDMVLGPCGRMFAAEWDDHCKKLATPPFPFGVIAGTAGRNPLIEGENDILVRVEEAKLPGARDFIALPIVHGEFMDDARSRECIVRFLKEGHFVSDQERMPIALEVAEPVGGK